MQYILKRGDRYYYNRRVPEALSEFVDKPVFRISLKTDSKKIALERANKINSDIESYWAKLLKDGQTHSDDRFLKAVKLAQHTGFNYVPLDKLPEQSDTEIIQRLHALKGQNHNSELAEALLGTINEPELTVSKALDVFWSITKNRIINKSEKQIRKWKNPRKKAVRNFINICGDLPIEKIKRMHLIQFRDWWIDRVENEGRSPNTVNKEIINLKNIVQTVAEHYGHKKDYARLFAKLTLEESYEQLRKPFSNAFIKDTLLHKDTFKDLNEDATNIVYTLINTSARPSEIIGLDESDIKLDDEIPHILIRPNEHRQLKTKYSSRQIPLIGCSLKALQKHPTGFLRYRGRADSFSGLVNKFFNNNDLCPTKKHSLYSLRHSFQDRLTRANVNDRLQAELMGHKFNRPLYGDGPTLEQKYTCLKEISF